jgi:chromosome segregation ATPase
VAEVAADLSGRQWSIINGVIGVSMFVGTLTTTIFVASRWSATIESQVGQIERGLISAQRQLESAITIGNQNAQQLAILNNAITVNIGERQRAIEENDRRHADSDRRVDALEAERIPSVSKIAQLEGTIARQGDKIDNVQRSVDELKALVRGEANRPSGLHSGR